MVNFKGERYTTSDSFRDECDLVLFYLFNKQIKEERQREGETEKAF